MPRFIVFITLYFLLIGTAVSQQTTVLRGVVRDSVSGMFLRGATVRLDSGKTGAITNKNGEFRLKLGEGAHTVQISMIGYRAQRLNVNTKDVRRGDTLTLTILLAEAASSTADVVVYAEDPAVRLMRKVLERKRRLADSLNTYSYTLYTKFDASTDTATAGRTSGRGDTTTISIFESYSKGYFAKPDRYYNEIIQRRQTANIPPEANIVAFGTTINCYDDFVTFFTEQIATPFHPDAIDYYDFAITGTINEDDSLKITRLSVKPKGGFRKLFEGVIDIDERNLVPVNAVLTPNRAVQLPFDATIQFEQTFQREKNFVLPLYMRIRSNVQANLWFLFSARLDINIETLVYDVSVNPTLDEGIFERRRTEVSKQADKFDTTFWAEKSVMQLRPEEAAAYRQIEESLESEDSSVSAGLFNQLFGWIPRTLAYFSRPPFTGFDDIFRYNRVHGAYLGLGARTDVEFISDALQASAKAGYGFADKRIYGEAGLHYFLDTNRKYGVNLTGYRRLQRRDNPYIVVPTTITTFSLLSKSDYGDYYYNNGFEASVEAGFGQIRFIRRDVFARPTNLRLFFRREFHETANVNTQWAIFGGDRSFRENPPVQRGIMQSVGFEAGYQFNPYRRIANFGVGVAVEHSSPAVGSQEFDFTAATLSLNLRTRTLALMRLDVRANAGYIHGNAPPQRFFSLESAVSGLAADAVFRSMGVKEFYGDAFASVSLEHNFGEVIPGLLRIPNIASFGIEFIGIARTGWTRFRPETIAQESAMNRPLLSSTDATSSRVFTELGLGINRLLLFFRIDITARLTQRNAPQFLLSFSGATL